MTSLPDLYHDQKRYRAAKQYYQRLLQHYPEHARSLINLADIAVAAGANRSKRMSCSCGRSMWPLTAPIRIVTGDDICNSRTIS
ncbi:hypothetical protein NKDENANG_03552 [Candidatus Entotheonellaceae bacterium PAL068K]